MAYTEKQDKRNTTNGMTPEKAKRRPPYVPPKKLMMKPGRKG